MTSAVLQATKGKLYAGKARSAAIARTGGQCRHLWNLFLRENIDRYEAAKKFIFCAEMSARLPKLLKSDPKLTGLSHRAAQKTVEKLDSALRDCFKGAANRKGFPRFKRRDDRSDAFSFVARECRFEPGRIRLPKIGWVRVRGLALPDGIDLGNKPVAITQAPDGWHVAVQFEAAAKDYGTPTKAIVGIDGGLNDTLILSDNRRAAAFRPAKKLAKRIARLNRERDRRRKGSVNRRRTVVRLGRVHCTIRDQRQNFLHKTTTKLVRRYAGFAVEDLSLKGLMRTRLAKSFADAGLGELYRQLAYKAEWAGREQRQMPRFTRSTGVCPDCGLVGPKLLLSVRTWRCEGCGAEHDRDVAAARVVLLRAVPQAMREPAEGTRRKRGAAARGGGRANARPSHGGSPSNVDKADENASCQ
jgi:putative transposase